MSNLKKNNKSLNKTVFLILLFIISFIVFIIIDSITKKIDSSSVIHLLGINFGTNSFGVVARALFGSAMLLSLFFFKFKKEEQYPELSYRTKFDILQLLISIAVGFALIRISWHIDGKTGWFVVAFIFFVLLEILFSYIVHIKNYKNHKKEYFIFFIWIIVLSSYLGCIYGVGIVGIASIVILLEILLGGKSNSNSYEPNSFTAYEDGKWDAILGKAPRSTNFEYRDGYDSH